jgi:hypothetical protein
MSTGLSTGLNLCGPTAARPAPPEVRQRSIRGGTPRRFGFRTSTGIGTGAGVGIAIIIAESLHLAVPREPVIQRLRALDDVLSTSDTKSSAVRLADVGAAADDDGGVVAPPYAIQCFVLLPSPGNGASSGRMAPETRVLAEAHTRTHTHSSVTRGLLAEAHTHTHTHTLVTQSSTKQHQRT